MPEIAPPPQEVVESNVATALTEDIGPGDITTEALIPEDATAHATIVVREAAVLCGRPWADETFRQLDERVVIDWHAADGDRLAADTVICELTGPARALLTGERTALNFLQLLCGTATQARRYADAVAGTGVRVLDTRKTIPGLRAAQKYAVRCGGCTNHRNGLYDAVLIKENHILAAGGIANAVTRARQSTSDAPIEVEVETLDELEQAIDAGADRALLDNFSLNDLHRAVASTSAAIALEASGNFDKRSLHDAAATGVHFISIGELTKRVHNTDLSMRFLPAL